MPAPPTITFFFKNADPPPRTYIVKGLFLYYKGLHIFILNLHYFYNLLFLICNLGSLQIKRKFTKIVFVTFFNSEA